MKIKKNFFLILIILLFVSSVLSSLCSSLSPPCSSPLGLESGLLPDSHLTASSSYSSSVMAQMGRLNSILGGGAWCPASVISNHSMEWLEVDLGREQMVTGVITQGRWDRGLGQEFAKYVMIQYMKEGEWVSEGGWRKANRDTFTPVVIQLQTGVRTHRVRIVPLSHHPRTVCIRLEVCGCPGQGHGQGGGEVHHLSDVEEHDEVDNIPQESDHTYHNIQEMSSYNEPIPSSYMSLVIGLLVTVIIILITAIIFILYKNYTSTRNYSSAVPKSDGSYQVYTDNTSYYTDSSTEYSSHLLIPQPRIQWNKQQQPQIYEPRISEKSSHYACSKIIVDRKSIERGYGDFL